MGGVFYSPIIRSQSFSELLCTWPVNFTSVSPLVFLS